MTTVIFSDIHNKIDKIESDLAKLKEKYNYDEVVFLGDYFDEFKDGPMDVAKTARWLRQSLQHPDRIHLLGNHDMPYMCPYNDAMWCPGYTPPKGRVVREEMEGMWDKMRPAYFTQGYLLSHAGFCDSLIEHPIMGTPDEAELVKKAEKDLADVKAGIPALLFMPGRRMATGMVGGITWADWDDEFEPIENVNQIVGHTPDRIKVRKLLAYNSTNYCMDTRGQHVGVIKDGNLTFILKQQL